jgi:hypothetical protein
LEGCDSRKSLEDKADGSYIDGVRAFKAHFDGEFIVLDEPAKLKPNDKVKVIADGDDDLTADFARLSESSFQKIWDNSLDADYDNI